jgi:hypothetical protein
MALLTSGISSIDRLPAPALGLLPAVHDATVELYVGTTMVYGTSNGLVTGTAVLAPLPPLSKNAVIQVAEDSPVVILPPFQAWPSARLSPGEYAACDGRLWYPAVRYKNTNSYYSKAFERQLYTFAFTAISLPLRTFWTLTRNFSFRLLSNNTNSVWNIVWEVGDRATETTPAPIGPNLLGYVWREPLLDEQVHITDVASEHKLGVRLYRQVGQEDPTNPISPEYWTGSINRYDKWVAVGSAQLPRTTDFVLRVRLSCFDTQNDVADPRGYVAYFASDPSQTQFNFK